MTHDDLQTRIDMFLDGQDVRFEGWGATIRALGDSPEVREIFVEMLRTHPQLTESLDRHPRDQAIALSKSVELVERKFSVQLETPSRADLIALLLPARDRNVPLEGAYERVVFAVLQNQVASKLHRDGRLARPFKYLVADWMVRSSLANREDVLFYALSWRIPRSRELAIQTLTETRQTETLVLAMQAIAVYGDREDAARVSPFLTDQRPAAERGFANGGRLQTQLGDVAMATIARLYEQPLTKVGFAKDVVDERFGFQAEDLGFPSNDGGRARQAALRKLKRLMNPQTPEGL